MQNKIANWLKKKRPVVGVILTLFFICGTFISIYGVFFVHPATKEDIYSLNESITEHIDSKFSGYKFVPLCTEFKRPIIKDGAVFIDKCSYLYKDYSFDTDGYAIGIKFRSSWFNAENKVHYLLDIGRYIEKNRVSLYEENNYLKLKICTDDDRDYSIKLNLKDMNWNDEKLSDEWNIVEVAWDKNSGHILLNINDKSTSEIIPELKLNMSDSQMFFGTDLNREYFAEGYYDYIYVRKYTFPEPTATLGSEVTLK